MAESGEKLTSLTRFPIITPVNFDFIHRTARASSISLAKNNFTLLVFEAYMRGYRRSRESKLTGSTRLPITTPVFVRFLRFLIL